MARTSNVHRLVTETVFRVGAGDPATVTGRMARTRPFRREAGWLTWAVEETSRQVFVADAL